MSSPVGEEECLGLGVVVLFLALELGAEGVAGWGLVLGAVAGPVAAVFACASCESYE